VRTDQNVLWYNSLKWYRLWYQSSLSALGADHKAGRFTTDLVNVRASGSGSAAWRRSVSDAVTSGAGAFTTFCSFSAAKHGNRIRSQDRNHRLLNPGWLVPDVANSLVQAVHNTASCTVHLGY
jgi:hypothetical protein